MFNRWSGGITKSMSLVEKEIIERQKTAITEAAGDLIKKAERQESTRFFKSILPGAIAASVVLVVGFVAGMHCTSSTERRVCSRAKPDR
jgi:hypothetical protein